MSLAHVNARCAYAQPMEKKTSTTTAEIIVNQNISYFPLPAPAPLLFVSTIEISSLCTRLASFQLSLLHFGHNIFNAKNMLLIDRGNIRSINISWANAKPSTVTRIGQANT